MASAAEFFHYKMKGLNSQAADGYTYHIYPLRNLTKKWMLSYQLSGLRSHCLSSNVPIDRIWDVSES